MRATCAVLHQGGCMTPAEATRRRNMAISICSFMKLYPIKINHCSGRQSEERQQAQSERLSGIAAPSWMHSGWMTGNHCGPPSCSAALSRHDVIPDATIDGRLYDPLSVPISIS